MGSGASIAQAADGAELLLLTAYERAGRRALPALSDAMKEAVSANYPAEVRALLDAGEPVNATDREGRTALIGCWISLSTFGRG